MKKDKDLEFRKKWLRWLLDFAQMDLGSLSEQKRRMLVGEIHFFCSEDLLRKSWDKDGHSVDLLEKGEYEALSEKVEPSRIQKKLIKRIKEMNAIQGPRKNQNFYYDDLPNTSSFIVSPSEGRFEIYRTPTKTTAENRAIVNFVNLIENLDTYPIKKCKGCERYFLNLSKREKIYCTSSCASRSIQREKREEIYRNEEKHEAFLKEWREYQKKRYRERGREIKRQKYVEKRKAEGYKKVTRYKRKED